MDNSNTIKKELDDPVVALPFSSFFEALKKRGFSVTPLQIIHAHQVIEQYAPLVKTEQDLCSFLAPLFASSQEQQEIFTSIFNDHFNIPVHKELSSGPKVLSEGWLKKNWKKIIAAFALLAACIIAIIIFVYINADKAEHKKTISRPVAHKNSPINSPGKRTEPQEVKDTDKKTDITISPEIIQPLPNIGTSINLTPLKVFYWILFSCFLALGLFFVFMWNKTLDHKDKRKKKVIEKLAELEAYSKNKTLYKALTFRNKNQVIANEPVISEVAKYMRKRVEDNIFSLHVERTINKTIKAGGLFQPVLAAKTRQSEYLVLIEDNKNNPMQLKLFEYLITGLKRQNVLCEVYFFTKEPRYCYDAIEHTETTLEKLSGKYNGHTLLIFGTGHQMIAKAHPVFHNYYKELFGLWKYKAIVTPVSYINWGAKEKSILSSAIPLFPADTKGLGLLSEMLNEDLPIEEVVSRLKKNKKYFYPVDAFNLKTVSGINDYCLQASWANVKIEGAVINVLLEWVAALAVYPTIRWEIIVAIGKVILDKYNLTEELNYTNLLRIVRIDWIKQGIFPDEIRLELLKKLDPEHEVLARQTVLQMLDETPVSTESYAEREMQRLTNEFTLYANDPIVYASYQSSKEVFQELWKHEKISETPLKAYFKNPDKAWRTPIQKVINTDQESDNIGINEYLVSSEKEETILSKLYLALCLISVFVFTISMFALIILYRQWEAMQHH